MPITIQEIIASDTISQLVDKTNFNFDQLLLNGGGPAGPAGIQGPIGPSGGRGPKGSLWYEDASTVSPGLAPTPTVPTTTPLSGDYYLQLNGDVWEFIGTVWVKTTINLTGPTGATGPAGGFGLEFGSTNINYSNSLYNGPIGTYDGGVTPDGPTLSNEGIPSIMIGGAVSTTSPINLTIPITDAYKIPDAIATALTSDVASLMIHQKNSSGTSIVFHGGNATGNVDHYNQTNITKLSNIKIGVNDRLILNIPSLPAFAASPGVMSDLLGFNVNSPKRSQSYLAGQQIVFSTGNDTNSYSVTDENSNFEISVGTGSSGTNNKFKVQTLSISSFTTMEMGGNIIIPTLNTTQTGKFSLQAGETSIVTSPGKTFTVNAASNIILNTIANAANQTGSISMTTKTGQISALTNSGGISLTTTSGDIGLTTTSGDIKLIGSAGNTTITVNDDIELNTTDAGDVISIDASGANNELNLTVNETSGIISIGSGGTNTKPQINVDYSGTNKVTNIKGALQHTKTGTWSNANADLQSIYIDNASTSYASGETIMRIGGEVISMSAGVGSLAINDGAFASIWMGKTAAGTGPSGLGLFVNSAGVFSQAAAVSPSPEKFSVTEATTKISNSMLWGGKNGTQEVTWDPMSPASPSTFFEITPISAYLKITAKTSGSYVNDNATWAQTFKILPTTEWYAGQRLHIEVTNIPSSYTQIVNGSPISSGQGGLISLTFPTFKNNTGTWTYETINCGGPAGGVGNGVTTAPAQPALPILTSWTQTFQWGGLEQTGTTGATPANPPATVGYSYTKGWTPIGTPVAHAFTL